MCTKLCFSSIFNILPVFVLKTQYQILHGKSVYLEAMQYYQQLHKLHGLPSRDIDPAKNVTGFA